MTPEDLAELYKTFRHSAWRLETRDTYAIPGEDTDFDDFLAGKPITPRTTENSPWLANIAVARAENRAFGRVRLVGHPITRYTEFEFASYPENIAAGEDVWVLDRSWLHNPDDAWTHQDFWLFDDEIAVLQVYDHDGRFLGVEQARDVRPYVEIRQRATAMAVPFSAYQLVPAPRRPTHDYTRRSVGAIEH